MGSSDGLHPGTATPEGRMKDRSMTVSRSELNHAIESCSRMKWWISKFADGLRWAPGRQDYWRTRHAGLSLMDGLER